ncbi:MAG TPA: M48 family metalloprotease [Acidiphilium sp.]|nr:MAG: peptidase [Acidiphilium sp. 21-60-14]OYV90561.1 MAG: peptidase [Acidiphilium sp. 37-60-79]OZB41486.1 MAG: peptidase [Acidiphilium sp. 34-60-192]HQT87590.1 M48 family metalloprotease [Acidiphilium sp.]HQU24629.1 M48 family metalloprotease [Acidiphilium sp.]
MSPIVKALRDSSESGFSTALTILGILLWVYFVIAIVAMMALKPAMGLLYILYFIGGVIFVVMSAGWYRAHAFGNMTMLSPRQFPELHKMVVEGAAQLGMAEPPTTFLYNSNGMLNAFARRLLGRPFVFLTASLVDVQNDEQIRFVIGHELGHHAAGHLRPVKQFIQAPGHLIPFLGKAYSRSREFTCDSIGCYLSGDAEAARSALGMLGCGCRRLNANLNCDAFADQEGLVPPFFGYLTEIFRTHPRLTRRIRAIRAHVQRAELVRAGLAQANPTAPVIAQYRPDYQGNAQ